MPCAMAVTHHCLPERVTHWPTLQDVMQRAIEREHTLLLHEQLASVQSNIEEMDRHYQKQRRLMDEAEMAEQQVWCLSGSAGRVVLGSG